MSESYMRVYFRVCRSQIAYLRFILESYDQLAGLSTVDAAEAVVEVAFPASRREEVDGLLQALTEEVGWEPLPDYRPLASEARA